MFVLIEQLGNELIWLEWMLDNPGTKSARQELELLQRALIAAMDTLIQKQPLANDVVLQEMKQHFQSIRNAIANESINLQPAVQDACRALSVLSA